MRNMQFAPGKYRCHDEPLEQCDLGPYDLDPEREDAWFVPQAPEDDAAALAQDSIWIREACFAGFCHAANRVNRREGHISAANWPLRRMLAPWFSATATPVLSG